MLIYIHIYIYIQRVYILESGNFIGEMGLHVGLHIATSLTSSATVTAMYEYNILKDENMHGYYNIVRLRLFFCKF